MAKKFSFTTYCRLESIPGGFSGSIWCTSDDWWKLKQKSSLHLIFFKRKIISILGLDIEGHAFPDKRKRLSLKVLNSTSYSKGTIFSLHLMYEERNCHLQFEFLRGHFLEFKEFHLAVLLLNLNFYIWGTTNSAFQFHLVPWYWIFDSGVRLYWSTASNWPLVSKSHTLQKPLMSRQIFQKFQKEAIFGAKGSIWWKTPVQKSRNTVLRLPSSWPSSATFR